MMLGKRKRDHAAIPRESLHEIEVHEATKPVLVTDLFRQYFEAKFEPLPPETSLPRKSIADEDELEKESLSETSDWSGFTDNDISVEEVPVVEHAVVPEASAESGALEGKYFMVRSSNILSKTSC